MVVSSCPRCGESVQIPPGASFAAQVRCPLCQEEYELGEALNDLPPTLVVLSDPESRESLPGATEVQASEAPAAFAFIGETSARGERAPAFQLDQPAPLESLPSEARPRPVTTPHRQRPRQQSMFSEMFKVVIGGMLGLAIGYVIIWWLPYGYGKDLLELGPTVAQHVPWIVPERFRGAKRIDNDPIDEYDSSRNAQERDRDADRDVNEPSDEFILLQDGSSSPFDNLTDEDTSPDDEPPASSAADSIPTIPPQDGSQEEANSAEESQPSSDTLDDAP